MSALVSAVGGVMVGVVLWDVFHTLWHPSGQGSLSNALMKAVWQLSRRGGPRMRQRAGPVSLVAVIGSWVLMVLVGGALVYWPHLPNSFSYSPGLTPGRSSELVDALYLSLVTMATLGFGDIVPTVPWLRIVTPLQALIGFALFTAAVSWVLQVYPALTRRRVLSLQIALLRDAGLLEAMNQTGGPVGAARLLESITQGITAVRVDLTQYTETFYFVESNPDAVLARTVPYARNLAEVAQRSPDPELRVAGAVLANALRALAEKLDAFLKTGEDPGAVFDAYTAEIIGSRHPKPRRTTASG